MISPSPSTAPTPASSGSTSRACTTGPTSPAGLVSIVQMPKGVPVATVAIGPWGAANAAILAAQILAVGDAALAERLAGYRRSLADEVEERGRRVAEKLRTRSGTS